MKITKHFPFEPEPSQLPLLFSKGDWVDCSRYWLNTASQGSVDWLTARKGLVPLEFLTEGESTNGKILISSRLTGSNFGAAAGFSKFTTPDELVLYISGLEEKKFSEESLSNMSHGNAYEPIARRWYEETTGMTVEEVGLAVPKWNFHLGASVDGIVKDSNGMVEIKCPKKMYKPLADHIHFRSTGWKPGNRHYHNHIWDSHYAQMQGGMAILKRGWCDYVVYSTSDGKAYKERIFFNEEYWERRLYPRLQSFLYNHLFPVLENIIGKY